MEIKGAIFDCDGTLVNSLGFWEMFYKRISDSFLDGESFIPDEADDKAMRTQTMDFTADILHGKYGIGTSKEEIEKWTLDFLTLYYREYVDLKCGVRPFLEHLKSKGIKMCIASASEARLIRLVLRKHGITDYFEDIISCSAVGAGKDKPDVFFAAEKFLGTPHSKTWVFEDSCLAIQTAKSAGFSVVGIYDAYSFDQDKSMAISDEYIGDGGSFEELIPKIK